MAVAKSKDTINQNDSGENTRWVAGLLLFIVGVYVTAATLFYFFDWQGDNSVLQGLNAENPRAEQTVYNPCGWLGAWMADRIVGRSLGLFGIILPIALMVFGLRLLRHKPLSLNRFGLSALLIAICGTVTLGFACGTGGDMFGSGWGGAWGVLAADWLNGSIGSIGTFILLCAGWILTGVFINSNFIHTVNRAGKMVVDGGEQILTTVTKKVVPHSTSGAEPQEAEPAPAPRPAPRPAPAPAVTPASEPAPAPEVSPEPEVSSAFQPAFQPTAEPMPGTTYQPAPEPVFGPAPDPVSATASETGTGRDAADPFTGVLQTPQGDTAENRSAAAQGASDEEMGRPRRMVSIDNLDEELQKMEAAQALGITSGRPAAEAPSPFTEIPIEGETDTERPAGTKPASEWMPTDDNPFVELPGEPEPRAGQPAAPNAANGTAKTDDTENPFMEVAEEPAGSAEPYGSAQHGSAPYDNGQHDNGQHDNGQYGNVRDGYVRDGYGYDARNDSRHEAEQGVVVTVEENEVRQMDEREIDTSLYDPLKDLRFYRKPTPGLMQDYPTDSKVTDVEIFENKSRIENVLKQFGIPIRSIHATPGPTVTLYEIVQGEGIKIAKIQGLENDIAQNLKALGIRLITPIPGKGTIGIEVPNKHKQIVSMYSSICSPEFQNSKAKLPVVIGRTIQNENFVFDLADMPHLLVAGATGQGKSVGLNAIITSLLYKKHPAELKFVMIDPKTVEFSLYAKIERHFLAKMESEDRAIITDPRKAVYTLNSLCTEMEARLALCGEAGARNITEYNEKFVNRRLDPRKGHRFMPYIVVVIDEFADLIMTAKEVEKPVMRLAQKARAIGIHLIVATQRPDVKVITGTIKANFPARIAFRVTQMNDSRTILDQPGANQLIGRGDMLLSRNGELTRIQCAFADTKDVECVVDYIGRQQGYPSAYPLPDYEPESGGDAPLGSEESSKPVKYDALFGDIARAAVESGQISTSHIQRTFEVGFNRAGRIMMQLQRAGIVGPQEGVKPREVLFHDLPSLEAKLQDLGVF